ncbi:MAG: FecR domain-containing protein [Planctomycetota bacterium]|jgi:ferric-dicitrate binding protein FerR (iron transport regulator)
MNCDKYKSAVEEYLDGTISKQMRAELENHTQTCESCRSEFNRCVLVQDVIKDALSSDTPAERAAASLLARLSAGPSRSVVRQAGGAVFSWGRQAAVAAGIILGVGLFLGFVLGRAGTVTPADAPLTAKVPISVTDIEGAVLVKHAGSDLWYGLTPESKVRLGDTFHCTAKSTCVLELDPNSTLELNQNSMLVLESFNGRTEFNLEHGELTADLESPHGPFFISTPHGRVEALGTEFTVKVTDE